MSVIPQKSRMFREMLRSAHLTAQASFDKSLHIITGASWSGASLIET